ncbi:hypothetical protein SBOR_4125 [Sclerotinia borealis F-4128]|uniref:Uncharacterized protein n=1 Tax=Sclerotinia borealis (strain F-4128) TaxID=1432307 RepID=W9CHY3_SCLBF|nr:hypothetical protein SBOR_4125 [Sclerotinia borealis F-4128]
MTIYVPNAKAHLLYLCAIHRIRGNQNAPYMAWTKVIDAMNVEAPRHLAGGDLFDTDPWPTRQYTVSNIRTVCRQWIRVRRFPIRGADPGMREGSMDMERMRVRYLLNDEQPESPGSIVAEHGSHQPSNVRLRGPQLPSLREVLSTPNVHPQPILNMNTRVVWGRLRRLNGRHRLPDALALPGESAHPDTSAPPDEPAIPDTLAPRVPDTQ